MKLVKDYYMRTLPKYFNSTNLVTKVINYLIVQRYKSINKKCDKYVRNEYPVCLKSVNKQRRENEIIVSLTTIPSRIEAIPYVMRSIFNQTMMPDKIILWLTDQIADDKREYVLDLLSVEIANGLEIRFVNDVRVHTKYYYAFLSYPDQIIITIDDDMIYPEDLIENLYNEHQKHPNTVIAARTHEITCSGNEINQYDKWHRLAPGNNNNNKFLLATGVGGVLYPPNCMYKDWKDSSLFLELCPTADDIWLRIMEAMNGVNVYKLNKYTRETFTLLGTQEVALVNTNVGQGRNDILLRRCQEYYGFDANLFL